MIKHKAIFIIFISLSVIS